MFRYKLRTLLIILTLVPAMLALAQELREAYRKSKCTSYETLATPIRIFGIPTPLRPRIVPYPR